MDAKSVVAKLLGMSAEANTQVDANTEDVIKKLEASLEEANTKLAAAAALEAKFVESVEKLEASHSEALAALSGELVKAKTAYTELVSKNLEAKMEVRKEQITSVIGTAKADAMFEAVKSLEDVAFAAVLEGLTTTMKLEANSDAFKELGVPADAKSTKKPKESKEMEILKAKYKVAQAAI